MSTSTRPPASRPPASRPPASGLPRPGASRVGGRPALAGVYFLLAAVGLVGTWFFNIEYFDMDFGRSGGAGLTDYLRGWFANPASSSVSVDVIVVAVMANVFFVVEGRRLGWTRWTWVLVPLTYLVALSFSFPFFLGVRELRRCRQQSRPPIPARPQLDTGS